MAFLFQQRYEPNIEDRMRAFSQMLSERDRRRFAALEAVRLALKTTPATFCAPQHAKGIVHPMPKRFASPLQCGWFFRYAMRGSIGAFSAPGRPPVRS